MLSRRLILFSLVLILFQTTAVMASKPSDYDELVKTDILVIGATPCGISAAIAAARCGSKVILAETKDHIGGMMTNGLGKTDIGPRYTIDGIFGELIKSSREHYVNTYGQDSEQFKASSDGYYFEPSVAESILNRMVKAEKNIKLKLRYRPEGVLMYGDRVHGVTFLDTKSRKRVQVRAGVFIDATYEGDIAAMAGVPYRVGRESREEFSEKVAGVLYMDHYARMILPGSTGKGDKRVQAYNYRICLTNDPANRVMQKKPSNYNRTEYLQVLESIEAGRIKTVQDVLNIESIPNRKSDTNNMPRALISTDLPEENYDYPDASYARREEIAKRCREYIQGLIFFLQNDSEMPEGLKAECREWGYAKDEYKKNDHFPRQLYVREARRIWGLYNFSLHDCMVAPGGLRTPIHFDSVACGGYATDSHATQKREPNQDAALEGFYWLGGVTRPYQIPYRVMVPQKVEALLVPGALSATHIGFGTLRMEPVWMALGQAAGTAAHLSRRLWIEPRNVPISRLQSWLVENGQIITAYSDILNLDKEISPEAKKGMQFFGTRGLSNSYEAKPFEPITRGDAARIIVTSVQMGDFMAAYGPFMKYRGAGDRLYSLTQLNGLIFIPIGDPDAILKDDEMAFWLDRIEPWIDGAIGDKWIERVRPKVNFQPVTEALDTGEEITHARFCEALFKKFRSATPAQIN